MPAPVSADPDPPRPRANPRKRWARRVGSLLLVLTLIGSAALFVLTRPAVLTPLLRDRLARATRVDVRLERASLSLGGVLRLEGLELTLPPNADAGRAGAPPEAAGFRELLEVDLLTVRVRRRELLRGRVDLRRIEVDGPTLHAVLDGRQGRSNLRAWADRFADGEEEAGEPAPLVLPPQISVRGAVLELVQPEAGGGAGGTKRHLLPFDGTVNPRGAGADATLFFELVGGVPEGASAAGSNLSGRWRPASRELVLSLERVDLGSPLGLLMPPGVRRYWRDLEPAGALPSLTLETRLDRRGTEAVERARLEVEGLSFRLPLASLGLLPEGDGVGDAPRMTGVTGSVVVEDGRLRTLGLTGEIEGIRCRIAGEAPLDGRGPVDLLAETEPFDVPSTPPLLFRLPGLISQIYDEYRPSGRFSARVKIQRERDRPVRVDGEVEAIDARAVFHAFAYPLEHMRGSLLFERDRLELRGMAGEGPGGGRVVLDGSITRPGPDAGIDLSIRVRELPIDDVLLDAMDPPLRRVVGDFFSREAADRLAAAAVAAGDPVEEPPGGALNGTVRVLRDTAVRPLSWIELTLDPEGLRVLMPAFPYPLTLRSGRLTAGPGEVRLSDLVATGPTGGAAVVRGRVGLGDPEAPPRIDVRLADVSLPVDRHLLGALDPEAAAWLRRLGVRGRITGGGLVGEGATGGEADPSGRLGLSLDLRLVDGALALWGGDVLLRPVEAGVRVTRDAVRIDSLAAGWPGGGSLAAEGRVEVPGGRLRLGFEARDLRFDERVALLIPPELPAREAAAGLLSTYRLSGLADATVTLRTGPGTEASDGEPGRPGPLTTEVLVRPREVRGRYDDRPVALSDVTGEVAFGEDAARLNGLTGRSGRARLRVSGRVPYDAAAEAAELELEAAGPASNPVFVAFSPAAVRDAAAAVGLEADLTLRGGRLRLGPTPPPGSAAAMPFGFRGRFGLSGVRASMGLPVERGELSATVRATGGGGRAWPELEVDAAADSLLYAGRELRSLRVHADNRERPAVLRLDPLTASLYGGRLTGSGRVRLGEDPGPGGPPPGAGSYTLDLAVDGAAAEPVLFAEAPPAAEPAEGGEAAWLPLADAAPGSGPGPVESASPAAATAPPERRGGEEGGRLWASLTAAGRAGLPETLTGRGLLRVRGGDLLRGQWGIGLLRAINLGLPTGEPLGEADASFTLIDGQARIGDATIGGAGLRLSGTGVVDFPSGDLYLTFFSSRETSRWFRGFQRLFDTIKDEFIGIEVTGTLWEPDARVASLAALRGAVEDRIGGTSAPQILPAAGASASGHPAPAEARIPGD